ncbi:MAG TPA: DUF58 domain-containing protein [Gammaproteobacteria bacterium]|jgi:uncharacterized protein (DUF58 family)|nr:DUF58 domain-containing protein [Gammaproteobacteria bacterium]HIL64095.1 DUF58 domain-containing protein [Porticoccaceae bacterium]HIN90559.1 DUF58 domain-containing protein [Porticoccaceae bacterium]|tara:strand:+ start:10765 stop:11658 length:894 start_codon:yes stop_codon:yes gene_type:complete
MSDSLNFLDPKVLAGLHNLELRARVVVEGFLAGLHKSPHRGFSVEFNDYRHYQRGDDMRHVDWRLYARSGKLYIKQYEDETNVRCVILLDTSASMAYTSGGMSKLDYGITLASALAYFIARQRDAVGLVTFDDEIREYLPAKTRQLHLMRILRALSRVQAGQKTDVVKPLTDLASSLKKKSMVILISDMLDDEERIINTLTNLRAMGNDIITFHIMDDAELNFPFNEASEFIDMENSESYITSPAAIRKAYLKNINEFLAYCKKQCQTSGIDYCLMNTREPLDQALSSYITKRSKSF